MFQETIFICTRETYLYVPGNHISGNIFGDRYALFEKYFRHQYIPIFFLRNIFEKYEIWIDLSLWNTSRPKLGASPCFGVGWGRGAKSLEYSSIHPTTPGCTVQCSIHPPIHTCTVQCRQDLRQTPPRAQLWRLASWPPTPGVRPSQYFTHSL